MTADHSITTGNPIIQVQYSFIFMAPFWILQTLPNASLTYNNNRRQFLTTLDTSNNWKKFVKPSPPKGPGYQNMAGSRLFDDKYIWSDFLVNIKAQSWQMFACGSKVHLLFNPSKYIFKCIIQVGSIATASRSF